MSTELYEFITENLITMTRSQINTRTIVLPQATLLKLLFEYFQALVTPQAFDPFTERTEFHPTSPGEA